MWTTASFVVVVALAFGLYWFQPWKLFVDHRVDEALPTVAVGAPAVTAAPVPNATLDAATPTGSPSASPSASPTAVPTASPRATAARARSNVLLSRGKLITHEHDTSGTVSIVKLADGNRVLTLQDLDTSDGPHVEVWLTDSRVISGERGWYVFDDGAHVSLGDLKGNQGNQVYKIPRGVELSRYTSVSLWCVRFDVSFGAAELKP